MEYFFGDHNFLDGHYICDMSNEFLMEKNQILKKFLQLFIAHKNVHKISARIYSKFSLIRHWMGATKK